MLNLKAVIEALLFASQKPLTAKEIEEILRSAAEYAPTVSEGAPVKSSIGEIEESLRSLQQEYNDLARSFQLVEQVSGWVLVSRSEFQTWIRELFPELRPTRLSPPALETLAIIAYRQPITKADVEAIRGVTIDGVLQKLLDAGLIKISGRAEVPGRPLLYETTHHFMEHFGLKSLDELPNAAELRQIDMPKAVVEVPHVPQSTPSQSAPATDPEQIRETKPTKEESENGEVQAVTGRDSQTN